MIHNFEESKKREDSTTWIHDKVLEQAFADIIYKENMKTYHFLGIDRTSCDYSTKEGKRNQKADIDGIIKVEVEENNKKDTIYKTLSEKTRDKYYGDIYLEIISILLPNENNEFKTINDYGWANKFCIAKDDNSAEYLSVVFLDRKANKYKALFIPKYKMLKEKLFNTESGILKDLINHKFINRINLEIKNTEKKGNSNFKIKSANQPYDYIVGAKNKSRSGQIYYTIGLTFSLQYLKSLNITIKEFEGPLNNQLQIKNANMK